eukprot:5156766-Pleurochrysis_carterae.AAC.1
MFASETTLLHRRISSQPASQCIQHSTSDGSAASQHIRYRGLHQPVSGFSAYAYACASWLAAGA